MYTCIRGRGGRCVREALTGSLQGWVLAAGLRPWGAVLSAPAGLSSVHCACRPEPTDAGVLGK